MRRPHPHRLHPEAERSEQPQPGEHRPGRAAVAERRGHLTTCILVEPSAQRPHQLPRRMVALCRVARHGLLDDRRQHDIDAPVDAVHGRHVTLQHSDADGLQRAAFKSAPTGEQFVQHHAHAVHIATRVEHRAEQLLRSCVVGRAEIVAFVLLLERDIGHQRTVLRGPGHARDAEVEQLGLRAADHEDVGGLDVAMHHATAVGVGQRLGQALGNAGGLRRLGAPAVGQQLAQVAALEPFHRDVDALLCQACVVDGDDVRVVQPGGGAGLGQQLHLARLPMGVDVMVGRVGMNMQGLDGDGPREQRVECRMHGAQAAAAELVFERVAPHIADRGQLVQRAIVDGPSARQRFGIVAIPGVGQLFRDGGCERGFGGFSSCDRNDRHGTASLSARDPPAASRGGKACIASRR